MILETERLQLRPWTLEDAEAMVDCLNHKEVSKWLPGLPHPYTISDAIGFIKGCEKRKHTNYYDWAIVLKETNTVIGGTALNLQTGNEKVGNLTYIYIHPDYQNQGYASEVWKKKIEFAWENEKIEMLQCGFLDGNEKSKAFQSKFGVEIIEEEHERQVTTFLRKDDYVKYTEQKNR